MKGMPKKTYNTRGTKGITETESDGAMAKSIEKEADVATTVMSEEDIRAKKDNEGLMEIMAFFQEAMNKQNETMRDLIQESNTKQNETMKKLIQESNTKQKEAMEQQNETMNKLVEESRQTKEGVYKQNAVINRQNESIKKLNDNIKEIGERVETLSTQVTREIEQCKEELCDKMLKVEENCDARHANVRQQIVTEVNLQKEINIRVETEIKENQDQITANTEQIHTMRNAEIPRIREEIEVIRNRPVNVTNCNTNYNNNKF